MPRGVPSRVLIEGGGSRAHTFTEIADGTGLSLSLVSLVMRGMRPVSPYAQARLAAFFRISIEELLTPGTIKVYTPPTRPARGRIVGYMRRPSYYSY